MNKYRKIFKNRNFFILLISQVISNFGDRLTLIALAALVFKRNPGSSIGLAKMFIFTLLPVFFIGPVAGAYVDRWSRKHTMVISDILRGILVLLIPFFLKFGDTLFLVYLAIFLLFSVTRFFLTSKMAVVPDIVEKEELLLANSLLSNTRTVATIVSLPLAGILVAGWGPRGGFYVDSLTFFVSAGMLSLASFASSHRYHEDIHLPAPVFGASRRRSLIAEIKEGVRYLFREEEIRQLVKSFFILIMAVGVVLIVGVVFVQEVFFSPSDPTATKELGLLGMFAGMGVLFGSLLYGRWGHRFPKMRAMFLSFVAGGATLACFALVCRFYPNPGTARILALILGLAVSPVVILSYTLIHEVIPPEIQGRAFSSLEIVLFLAIFSFIPASILGEFIPKWWIILSGGIFLFIFGLAELSRGPEDEKK